MVAGGGHDVGGDQAIGGVAILTGQPSGAASERVADDAHAGRTPGQRGEAEALRFRDDFFPLHAGLYAGGSRFRVDGDAFHTGGVDEESTVAGGYQTVSGPLHGNAEIVFARKPDAGENVRIALGHEDRRRVLVHGEVPTSACFVIT